MIRVEGMKYLSDALETNKVEQNTFAFYISYSDIIFVDAIQTLTKLNLANNRIEDEGIKYLSNALQHNSVR